jgi:transposase InsO family protein
MEESRSYSIEKLNESNYRSWSQVIESHLDDQGLWDIVIGTEKKPTNPSSSESTAETTAGDTAVEEWTKKAKKARKIIISTINPSVMIYVEGMRDPAEMWKTLEERYKPKTRVTLRQLQRQFNTIKMTDDDGDMEKHLQRVEALKRQIEEQGERISESSYVSVLLNCAPSRYDVQVSILEAQDDVKPATIMNRLLEEYRKFLATKENKPGIALVSAQGKGKGPKKNTKFDGKCNHCKRTGHKENQCWIKHPELKPVKQGKEKQKFSMMATVMHRQSDPNVWYADSGASDHFSPHRHLFKTFRNLDEPTTIGMAKGTATGTGIGTIEITVIGQNDEETELQLNDVIYAPNMYSNLFSLGVAYDLGYETRITPGKGLRVFHEDTVVLQTIREGSGLFRLAMASQTAYAKAAKTNAEPVRGVPELDMEIWHKRLAHLNEDYVRRLASMSEGMKIKARTTVGVCDACMEGKQHRQPSHKPATRASEALELIHSDLCGVISPTTYGGTKYFLLFIDDHTGYTHVYALKDKKSETVMEKFREYKAEVENQLGKSIKRLRTDGGGEYGKWMASYLKEHGIIHETTAPYSPEQNGVAERANRTIIERVKAIISEGKLDKRLWMELVAAVVYLKNRSPTKAVRTTPYEAWHGVKPNLSHIRILGSTAYIHIPSEKRVKLDMNAHKGILIGYGGTNQYRIWDPVRNEVVVSRDVKIIEEPPAAQATIEEAVQEDPETTVQEEPEAMAQEEPEDEYDSITVMPLADQPEPGRPNVRQSGEPEQVNPGQQRASGRSNKGTRKTPRYADIDWSQTQATAKIARTITDSEEEPANMQEALNHPTRGKQWEQAFQEEYNSLIKNETWELVPRPKNRNVITNKWVLNHKRNQQGEIVRLKARLVARGFSQIYGVDYMDTFAPVAKLASIRILFAIAAIYDLEVDQMDVVTAFLAAPLQEEIYMEQPEGFEIGKDMVCRLLRSLYGLKQSARVWNQRIREFLKSIGFQQTYSDPCVFVNPQTGIILAIWVDDLLIFAKDKKGMNDVKAALKDEYEMKDLGELQYFVGIQVHRNRKEKLFHINQSGYVKAILERYDMDESNPASVPLSQGTQLKKATIDDRLAIPSEYQSIVGSQMYAMLATRPDLAQSIQQISQHNQKPTTTHLKAARQGLRYLKGTMDQGITYDGKQGLKIKAWCDANWGAEEGRESVSGFVFTIAGGAISWSSKKQSSVALSSTESEYMAILHALKEQIWIRRLLTELGYDVSDQNTIYTDSQSAIALAQNPEHHARTKHIDIQYHFVRNCVEDGRLRLEYCPTEDMVADGLTKALGPEQHKKLTAKMGMEIWNGGRSGKSKDGRSVSKDREAARTRSGSVGSVSSMAAALALRGERGASPLGESGDGTRRSCKGPSAMNRAVGGG